MAFGHAQLLLYRPFLHYVSSTYKDNATDQRAFACASACVSVSRNIIHITSEMRRRGLLAGAYWFSMYTTFFAIVSILYFVLENPNSPTSVELLRDAAEGKEVLAYFAKRSMAADRCSSALNVGFAKHSLWIGTHTYLSHRLCSKGFPMQSSKAGKSKNQGSVARTARHSLLARVRIFSRVISHCLDEPALSPRAILTASAPLLVHLCRYRSHTTPVLDWIRLSTRHRHRTPISSKHYLV